MYVYVAKESISKELGLSFPNWKSLTCMPQKFWKKIPKQTKKPTTTTTKKTPKTKKTNQTKNTKPKAKYTKTTNPQTCFYTSFFFIFLLMQYTFNEQRIYWECISKTSGLLLWVIVESYLKRSSWPHYHSSSEPGWGSIFWAVGICVLLVEFVRSGHRQQ